MSFELNDTGGQRAVIKVLGVGGCGGNVIKHMVKQRIAGVDFLAANTDAQALEKISPKANKIQIGLSTTKGLGAGAKPQIGRDAALEDKDRLREVVEKISANSVNAINFDHHPDLNDKRFSENYIQMTAAATGEMVYDFLKSVNVDLSLAMANGIYTAVMTDTGSFCYSNTNQKCHQIAIECLEAGVNTSQIYQTVYENRTPGQVKLLAEIINNLNYSDNQELAWFTISQEMMKNANASKKDIDGFSDFVRTIQGVEVALMIFQNTNGTCRVNFRSKGKYIINTIAKSLGGGGHKFAAGAIKKGSLNDVLDDVLSETSNQLIKQDSNFS